MTPAKSGRPGRGAGEVFVECTEKRSFPVLGSSAGRNSALAGAKTAPGGRIQFAGPRLGSLWYVEPNPGAKMEILVNNLQSPVRVEQVIAERKVYKSNSPGGSATLRLPPLPALTRDLEIDYTALCLLAPGENSFQVPAGRPMMTIGSSPATGDRPSTPVARLACTGSESSRVITEASGTKTALCRSFPSPPPTTRRSCLGVACAAAVIVLFWGLYRLRTSTFRARIPRDP